MVTFWDYFEVRTLVNKIIVDGSTNNRHFPVNMKLNANTSHSHSENLFQVSDWKAASTAADIRERLFALRWLCDLFLLNTLTRTAEHCDKKTNEQNISQPLSAAVEYSLWSYKKKLCFTVINGLSKGVHQSHHTWTTLFSSPSFLFCRTLPVIRYREIEAEILRLDDSHGSLRDKSSNFDVVATTKSLFRESSQQSRIAIKGNISWKFNYRLHMQLFCLYKIEAFEEKKIVHDWQRQLRQRREYIVGAFVYVSGIQLWLKMFAMPRLKRKSRFSPFVNHRRSRNVYSVFRVFVFFAVGL